MSDIKELIASKLRPVANAVRTKSGKTELIPVDDLEDEILALPDTEALRQSLKQIIEKTGTFFEIPYGIEKIGSHTFRSWTNLESVSIPDSVETIGDYAFDYCSKLKSIIIPNSVKTIGEYAFNMTGLTELEIPDSITEIPKNMIASSNLRKLVLPKTITLINTNAFNTPRLSGALNDSTCGFYFKGTLDDYLKIVFADTTSHPYFGNKQNYQYNNYLYFYNESTNTFENVSELFLDIEKIPNNSFYACTIKKITLSNNVKTIGTYAFGYAWSVNEFIIPDSVETIEPRAFESNTIKQIVIGSNVKTIGMFAFNSNFFKASTIIMKATTPPALGNSNFNGASKIFVPLGTRNAYISATNWSALASKIVEPNTINVSIPSQLLNNENYTYSIDGSSEFNQFTSSAIVIENVSTIKFKNLDAATTILIGTTEGGSDIGTIANAELTYATSGNQTIYLTVA